MNAMEATVCIDKTELQLKPLIVAILRNKPICY